MKYALIVGSYQHVEKQVNERLCEGYSLYSAIKMTDGGYFVREMIHNDSGPEGGDDADTKRLLSHVIHNQKELSKEIQMAKQDLLNAIAASEAEVKQHITDASARVTKDVNTLTATVADLQAKIGDVLTQEDVDPILAANKDLVTSVDAIDPATPPPNPVVTP